MIRSFYEFSIPALWTMWLIYWSIAAFGAKRTRQEEGYASRLSHMLPLGLGVGLLAMRGGDVVQVSGQDAAARGADTPREVMPDFLRYSIAALRLGVADPRVM